MLPDNARGFSMSVAFAILRDGPVGKDHSVNCEL